MPKTPKYRYVVAWSEEDAVYYATCPAFPGVSAFADTAADAILEIEGVMEEILRIAEEDGDPLPDPQFVLEYSGKLSLRIGRSLHGQVAERAEVEGISINALIAQYIATGLAGRPERSATGLKEEFGKLDGVIAEDTPAIAANSGFAVPVIRDFGRQLHREGDASDDEYQDPKLRQILRQSSHEPSFSNFESIS